MIFERSEALEQVLSMALGDLFVAYPNGEEIGSLPVHTAQLILKM